MLDGIQASLAAIVAAGAHEEQAATLPAPASPASHESLAIAPYAPPEVAIPVESRMTEIQRVSSLFDAAGAAEEPAASPTSLAFPDRSVPSVSPGTVAMAVLAPQVANVPATSTRTMVQRPASLL